MGVGGMVSLNIVNPESHFLPLNLTFYELQSHMGTLPKPLSEINLGDLTLDELLQVLFTDPHHLIPKLSSSPVPSVLFGNLNGPLSTITVEEIWRQVGLLRVNENNVQIGNHPTLGETTIENFVLQVNLMCDICDSLYSTVVVDSKTGLAMDPTPMMSQGLHQHQQMTIADSNFAVPKILYENLLMKESDMVFTVNSGCHTTFNMFTDEEIERVNSGCHTTFNMFTDDEIERAKEKKLKRMMKNRESAARSRAKKQAYTNQLEQEKSALTDKNAQLKKEIAFLRSNLACQPKCQLRRSNSLPATTAQLAAIYRVPTTVQ